MQQHRDALLFRQRRNRAADEFGTVALDHLFVNTQFACRQLQRRDVFFHRRVNRHIHLVIAIIAQRIQRQVRRDAKQPGGKFRAGRILLPRAIHAQKNFLRQVFRRRRIADHAIKKINQRRAIFLEKEVKGRVVPSLHVQHQLDVRPGHGLHILSNTCSHLKLQKPQMCLNGRFSDPLNPASRKELLNLGGLAISNQTRKRYLNPKRIATPRNTNNGIPAPGSLFTSGIRSDAATYSVTPAENGNAAPTTSPSANISAIPKSVAPPKIADDQNAARRLCPLANINDATVNPSGSLWRNIARKITNPSEVETRRPDAIATPSKNVWITSPSSAA